MKKLLLPLILGLVGLGGGVGAGLFLMPEPEPEMAADEGTCACAEGVSAALPDAESDAADPALPDGREFARLNNQFVIPVVEDGAVGSLVVLSLSLEVLSGSQQDVYSQEPRIRDAFLEVLFDHANGGGFSGAFTSSANLRGLRDALRERAQQTLGTLVTDVLIVDIVRQDV